MSTVNIQVLKAKFENIGSARDDISVQAAVCKPRPVFQRSKTSLQLSSPKTNGVQLRPKSCKASPDTAKQLLFSRHLDDSKRASIKRSPAFRASTNHKSIHRTSSTPQPLPMLVAQCQQVDEAIQRNSEVNLTDTLKKALSQPLPTGPPPKKPPRLFETAVIAGARIEAIHVHNNNKQSVRQVASDKISTFVDQNFLNCFTTCAAKDPIYDLVPFEPIYMEPFSHLKRRPSQECGEKHDHSANGDLHYMVSEFFCCC